jgi:hypothetical protein
VEVSLDRGDVRVGRIADAVVELDEGSLEVEDVERVRAEVGTGTVQARLAADADARFTVASGDVSVRLAAAPWTVDVEAASESVDVESQPGGGNVAILAPAGRATVVAI